MPSEQELVEQRREKREALLAAGDPYPATIRRTHEIAKARVLFERNEREGLEETRRALTIAGRVVAIRDMGRAAFVDVRDGSGTVQLHLRRNVLGEDFGRTADHAKLARVSPPDAPDPPAQGGRESDR